MVLRTSIAVILALALPAAAAATPPSAPAGTRDRLDPNQVVCQKVEQTGSRLAVRRICKTRSEWAQQRLQERQDVEKLQTVQTVKD